MIHQNTQTPPPNSPKAALSRLRGLVVPTLPVWMRPHHPSLRYWRELPRSETVLARSARALLYVLTLAALLCAGYLAASEGFSENPLDQPFAEMLHNVLFWPVLLVQILLVVTASVTATNTVIEKDRRQTWEDVRVTPGGMALALRTRWSALVLYRLRGLWALVLLARLALIAGLLYDLTAFRGEYLDHILANLTPALPPAVGVLWLGALLTASLLLPLTNVGLDAAFGLLASTCVRQRFSVTLAQIVQVCLRVAVIGVLLMGADVFRAGDLTPPDLSVWLLMLAFAAFGDWGLSFLWLGFWADKIWADVPYGSLIALAALGVVLTQAALIDVLLTLAIRRAETQAE